MFKSYGLSNLVCRTLSSDKDAFLGIYQLDFLTYLNKTGKRSSYSRNAQSIVKGRRHIFWDEEQSRKQGVHCKQQLYVVHESGIFFSARGGCSISNHDQICLTGVRVTCTWLTWLASRALWLGQCNQLSLRSCRLPVDTLPRPHGRGHIFMKNYRISIWIYWTAFALNLRSCVCRSRPSWHLLYKNADAKPP